MQQLIFITLVKIFRERILRKTFCLMPAVHGQTIFQNTNKKNGRTSLFLKRRCDINFIITHLIILQMARVRPLWGPWHIIKHSAPYAVMFGVSVGMWIYFTQPKVQYSSHLTRIEPMIREKVHDH